MEGSFVNRFALGNSTCLRHRQPEEMRGYHLLSLSQLREQQPEIAAKYAAKYKGREDITKRYIPALDCTWDEVIFLSAIHPQLITNGFAQAGISRPAITSYQFPVHLLAGHEAIYVDLSQSLPGRDESSISPQAVSAFDIGTYSSLPLSYKAVPYYRSMNDRGLKPLELYTEPHLLVRAKHRDGTPNPLDIRNFQLITTPPGQVTIPSLR